MKPSIGTFVDPITGQEVVTKAYGDATYSAGGTNISAQGAYISKRMSASQGGVTTNTALNFDTVEYSRGDLDGSGIQVTGLKAGRTYLLIGRARISSSAGQAVQFYDATNAAYLGHPSSATGSNQYETPNTTHIFTPLVDTAVELWCAYASTAATYDGLWAEMQVIEIGAVQANVVGGLEFMDIITVDSPVADVTFGATGDGAHQRALDGDVDGIYEVEFSLIDTGGTAGSFVIAPNNITANQSSRRTTVDTGTDATQSSMGFALADAGTDLRKAGSFTFHASKLLGGDRRTYICQSIMNNTAHDASSLHHRSWVGSWQDVVTNITSLVLGTNDASANIGAGSWFKLYRRTTNNLRADSASTYERNVEAVVAQGTTAEVEYTTGHATYAGAAVGVSVSLNDVVTAGTITVNVKVAGATKLTAVLDTTNTTFARDLKNVGVAAVVLGDEIIVGIETSGLVTTGGASPGITVNTTLVNYSFLGMAGGFLGTANTYTKAQVVAPVTLTWGANIAMVASDSNVFDVTLAGATAQLDNPTDLVDGQTIVLRAYQDVTGGRGLTFDTAWDFGEDGPPDLTAEAGDKMSIITGVSDGTKIAASAKLGFTP